MYFHIISVNSPLLAASHATGHNVPEGPTPSGMSLVRGGHMGQSGEGTYFHP